jgi:hypothetical protein
MKRMSVTGLCLMAVLCVAAVAAVSASAETFPSYKVCVKAAKVGKHYTGRYSTKECSEVNAKDEGKYEREGISRATKLGYAGKSGESVFDSYVEGAEGPVVVGTVSCKKSTDTGEITGEATADQVTTFEGCSSSGASCTSAGAKAGEIVTDPVLTTLVTLKEETRTTPVVIGLDEAGTGGEEKDATAEFTCATKTVTTTGSVLGVVTGDVGGAGKSQTDTFALDEAGENEYEHVAGGVAHEHVLISTIKGVGAFDTAEEATAEQKITGIIIEPPPSEPCECPCEPPHTGPARC